MTMRRQAAIFAVLSLGCAPSAMAQQAEAPASTDPVASTDAGGLQDIVVTAQRRSENLQRVPIAVSAFSERDLEVAQIKTTADLVRITPAVTLYNSSGFISPRIRGIGNSSAGPGVENAIAVYVDGVYISSSPGSLMSLSNVARVEVLKGPQGTLFGRNATGGLIQVVTKDPGETFGGAAHVGYGNYQTLTGDLYVSAPLGEGTGIDLSLSGKTMGKGFGVNIGNGQDLYRTRHDISARSKLVSHLGDNTTLRLAVDYADQEGNDPPAVSKSGTATSAYRTPAPDRTPIVITHDTWDANEDGLIDRELKAGGASLRLDHDFGAVALTSITAYRALRFFQLIDADFSPVQGASLDYIQRDRQFSQEVQLASSGDGPLRWIIGGYYFRLTSKYDPQRVVAGAPPAQSFAFLRDQSFTESLAAFGQVTWAVTDDTNLTGGFRYTTDRRRLENTSVTSVSAAGVTTVTSLEDKRVSYSTPTWRLSVDHNFTPDVMAYASWNRGYKSGGYNAQSPTAPAYGPEKLDAYEIGFKSLLADRRVRLNAALFYYNHRNVQVNTFIGAVGLIYNGAKAEVYGLDADFDVAVSSRFNINGGVVLLHDRFKDFPAAQVATLQPNGLYVIAPGSATGNRLPFAPDVTFNLGVRYTLPIGEDSAVFAVNNLYSTGYYTQPDNVLKQGTYDLVNASLTYNLGDSYSIKAFANNITNKAVAIQLTATASATGVSYQAPQTFGVEFGVKF